MRTCWCSTLSVNSEGLNRRLVTGSLFPRVSSSLRAYSTCPVSGFRICNRVDGTHGRLIVLSFRHLLEHVLEHQRGTGTVKLWFQARSFRCWWLMVLVLNLYKVVVAWGQCGQIVNAQMSMVMTPKWMSSRVEHQVLTMNPVPRFWIYSIECCGHYISVSFVYCTCWNT